MKLENTKIWIRNPGECERVQRELFKRGFSWGGDDGRKEISNTNSTGLFLYPDKVIRYSTGNRVSFDEDSKKEIKVSLLLNNKLDKAKKEMMK